MEHFRKGDKVHYIPFEGCEDSVKENGIIKRVHPDGGKAWVVYNCSGNWDRLDDYTAALTDFDLLGREWLSSARNANLCNF